MTTSTEPSQRILIIAPHPDDDIIGCGGSIACYLQNGISITVVFMTSGDAGCLETSTEDTASIREAEAKAAAGVLGQMDLEFLRNPDGYIQANQEKNLISLTRIIRRQKPAVIYFPHRHEGHIDHRATHDIVREAARRAGGPWFTECGTPPWSAKTLLCYEVWTPIQNISYVEDISSYMDLKVQALTMHHSQIASLPYHEAVRALNRFRGITTGKGEYCECFEVLAVDNIPF
jgi:LmbE family N-acetylglucosaminyl deacetylase